MKSILLLILPILSKIIVLHPESMRQDFEERYPSGDIPASLGNFGNPPYGSSLVGHVYYPLVIEDRSGCSTLSPIKFSTDSDPDLVNTPILILDRGDCAFVVKVRHAEDIGAKLVIIANHDNSDPESIIMTDNGQGGNLNIPAMLISKSDADLIKKYLNDVKNPEKISLSVSFDMQKTSDVISYSIWSTPTSYLSQIFMMSFADVGSQFVRKVAEFAPYYVLWYCPDCENDGYIEDHPDCVSGGRYCSPDPDEDGVLTGRDVMFEDLRQLCIYKLYSKNDYKQWFHYQKEYYLSCGLEAFSTTCSRKLMNKIGVSFTEVQTCVDNSFEGKNPALDDNSILRNQMDAWLDVNIPYYPSIVINEQIYRGDLEAKSVMDAMCSGYMWGSEPQPCKDRYPDKNNDKEEESGSNTFLIIIAVIASILLVAGILIIYKVIVKKDLNRDMKVQVNNAVAQYFQLAEVHNT